MAKVNKIKTLIRQIVREEVAMAIGEVITELKQPSLSSLPKPAQSKAIKKTKKKHYSKNSVINDILNETTLDDDWKTLNGQTFDSTKMGDVLSSAYNDNSNPNGNLAAEMGVNPNAPGMDFLKKDYRAVMKAVDKKVKEKQG